MDELLSDIERNQRMLVSILIGYKHQIEGSPQEEFSRQSVMGRIRHIVSLVELFVQPGRKSTDKIPVKLKKGPSYPKVLSPEEIAVIRDALLVARDKQDAKCGLEGCPCTMNIESCSDFFQTAIDTLEMA